MIAMHRVPVIIQVQVSETKFIHCIQLSKSSRVHIIICCQPCRDDSICKIEFMCCVVNDRHTVTDTLW